MSPDILDNCAAIDAGDTAWMIVSTVLVLGMIPGLSLFEAGLLRSKNTVSVNTQVIAGVTILSMLWGIVGFSIVFGESVGSVIGNPATYFLLQNLEDKCLPRAPGLVFAAFQTMFASITPLLMTGSFAGRLRFKAYLIFIVLWEIIVYYPLAFAIWGKGVLSPTGNVGHNGVLDFAGGIVIHTSAGIGALVSALVLGKRVDFEEKDGTYHASNLPLAIIGACFLWVGWFGFNGGSAFTSGPKTTAAIINTHLSASVSGVTWSDLYESKVSPSTSVIAGLALITPASGYITAYSALGLSVVGGVTSYWGVWLLKDKLRIDDALDVTVVHGFTGVLGSLAIGFLSTTSVNPSGLDGLFYGRAIQLPMQLLGVAVALGWSGAWTFLLLKGIDLITPIRASREDEEKGLDLAEHGELAYDYAYKKLDYEPSLNHGGYVSLPNADD